MRTYGNTRTQKEILFRTKDKNGNLYSQFIMTFTDITPARLFIAAQDEARLFSLAEPIINTSLQELEEWLNPHFDRPEIKVATMTDNKDVGSLYISHNIYPEGLP